MKVEMWADVVCSWCGIANERINAAIEQFEHGRDTELQHKSFRLLPELPEGTGWEFTEYMSTQRGATEQEATEMARRIEDIAHADGIEAYHVAGNTIGNTTLAHEFLAWATSKGKHREAWDLVFREKFGNRVEIWTSEELAAFAEPLGLDAQEARAALDERRFRSSVEADHAELTALGSGGVPFVVIDRTYALSGAKPVSTIVAALEQAWNERASA